MSQEQNTQQAILEKLNEDLRQSEEKWRSFVAKSPDGIVISRIDGYIEEISPKTLKIFGYDNIDEGLGKCTFDFLDPSCLEMAHLLLKDVLAGNETGINEFLAVRKDGSRFYIEVSSEVFRNNAGEPVSFFHIIRDITHRKNTENALLERETEYHRLYRMFRLMSDTMPDMMWAKDLEKRYIFANRAVCENLLNAIDTSEPLGKNDLFFAEREQKSHPEDPGWHTFGETCMDTDDITLRELKKLQFNEFGNVKGKFLFLDVHKAPLFNSDGQLFGVVGSARDVTDKIQAGKRMSMLAQAIQSVSECVSITDMNDNIIYVNNAFLKTYQYEEHELIGQPIMMVRSRKNPAEIIDAILPATLKGGWHGQLINLKKDGTEFPVYVSTSVISDDNGTIQWLIGVTTDISEQIKAQQELQESEARNKALLSAIPDLMFMFNRQGDFIDYHVSDQKLLLIDPELFMNRNVYDVLPYDLAIETMRHLDDVFKNGTTAVYEYTIQLGTDVQLFESRIVPCGKDSALSIVRDITDQKKLESQMIQSERLTALGEMSAGMAHEINQPLNTLSMLFDNILFEASENHTVSESYLVSKSEKIFNNIHRIRNIIDHVREFSRESDRDAPTPFNVNDSIRNALSMVSEQYKMAGIDLRINFDENIPLIKGSTYKFERIILNLIINSKDALIEKMDELAESYIMYIKLSTVFDRRTIRIEVSDNGCGIPAEHLGKILQPFYTTKETGKGTGLGLSISYGLIREMGGNIDIQSKVMRGTTITVTIPYKSK